MMRHVCVILRLAVLLLGVTATLSAAEPTQSPPVCQTFRVRDQDQIWVFSTRCLGCPVGGEQEPAWQVWRYEKGWWQPSTTDSFHEQPGADLLTPIYVHGNRYEHSAALREGLDVYFQLVGKLDDQPPVRFVIWSWPSSQIKGPLRDVRAKAARSDIDAYYFGRFLAGMKPEVHVGLLTYSLGARIISGGLHLTNGGSLLGYTIAVSDPPHVRAALWVAAEHNHWYLQGNFHDRALAAADAWFITINPCDPVLARYHMLEKCGNPVAVGYAGIYGRNLLPPDVNARIEEVNISNIVGASHDMSPYLYSLYIQNRTRQYVLWRDLDQGGVGSLFRQSVVHNKQTPTEVESRPPDVDDDAEAPDDEH